MWFLSPYLLITTTALHHIFPTVDESRHPSLKPLLMDACREFDLGYRSHSFYELHNGCLNTWCRRDKSAPHYPREYGKPSVMKKKGGGVKLKAQ